MKRAYRILLANITMTSVLLAACGTKAVTETPVVVTQAPVEPTATPTCAAAVGSEPIPFPNGGKSVTGGISLEPDNIYPEFGQAAPYSAWISQLTQVGLAEWDQDGNPVPELAAEVPTTENGGISADGLTITWHLKPCLYWSDGKPLTSRDVKFTWEAIVNPANVPVTTEGYVKISSIDTPDDRTVVLHFSELYPAWFTLFTQNTWNAGAILPAHILEGQTALETNPFIHMPTVASGPFVLTEWTPGDHITLLPNPNFFKGRPILDRVLIKFVADSDTAMAALQTGDIDWYLEFDESHIKALQSLAPNVVMKVVPSTELEQYIFNLSTTAGVTLPDGTVAGKADADGFCPFKDANIRKAIIMGINRQAIVDNLLAGLTTIPADLWPNSPWENTSLTPYPYDPEQAKTLLDQAGYAVGADGIRHGMCNGVDTKLSINFVTTNKQIRQDIGTAVQSDLKKIGIEFKPNYVRPAMFFASYEDGGILATGAFDMAGYATGYKPDPYTDQFECATVPSTNNPSDTIWYHFCDPTLDDLSKQINASADPNVRKAALVKIQQYQYDKAFFVPLYVSPIVFGFTPRFKYGPYGFYSNLLWNAEVWDVTTP